MSKVKTIIKISSLVFGVIFLMLLSLYTYLRYGDFDIPEQDFSDMMPVRRNIPKEQNAYFVYREAYAKVKDKEIFDQIHDGHVFTEEELKKIVKSNAEAFSLIKQGLELDYEEPDVKSLFDPMPHLEELRNLSYLIACLRYAPEQLDKYSIFFIQLFNASESLVSYSNSSYCFTIGLEAMKGKMNHGQLLNFEDQEKKALVASLQGEMEFMNSFMKLVLNKRISFWEYLSGEVEAVDYFSQYSYMFQINKTKLLFYESFKGFGSARFYTDLIPQMNTLAEYNQAPNNLDNCVGKLSAMVLSSTMENRYEKPFKLRFISRAALIRKKLYSYKNDNGQFPEKLSKLVPKYLEKVPQDPFDGKEIRYEREGGLLYSVGENLIDDGAYIEDGKYYHFDRQGDIVFRFAEVTGE